MRMEESGGADSGAGDGAGGSEGVERDRVRAPGAQGCQDDTIPGYPINLQSVILIQSDSTT